MRWIISKEVRKKTIVVFQNIKRTSFLTVLSSKDYINKMFMSCSNSSRILIQSYICAIGRGRTVIRSSGTFTIHGSINI